VRRARLRLWFATTTRHLKQGKLHLVNKDLAVAPPADVGANQPPPVVAAVRVVAHHLRGDRSAASAARTDLSSQLKAESAADVLIQAVADASGAEISKLTVTRRSARGAPKDHQMPALVEASSIAEAVGLAVVIPGGWHRRMVKELNHRACQLDSGKLLQLAQVARRQQIDPLAYAAARRDRDEDLVKQVFAFLESVNDPWDDDEFAVDEDELRQIIEYEQKTKAYPGRVRGGGDDAGLFDELDGFDDGFAPARRRRTQNRPNEIDFDPPFRLEESVQEVFGDDVPPELLPVMLDVLINHGVPKGTADFERIIRSNPDLRRRFEEAIHEADRRGNLYVEPSRPRRKRKRKR